MPANANIIIVQKPLYKGMPVGQEIIFSITDNNIVLNYERVKFVATLQAGHSSSALYSIATLKVTPNNAGAGMFDFRSLLETTVNPEYNANGVGVGVPSGGTNSTYLGTDYTYEKPFPMHLVDCFSLTNEMSVWFRVYFGVEYLDGNNVALDDNIIVSDYYFTFNGFVKNEETLVSDFASNVYRMGLNLQSLDTKVITNLQYQNFIQQNDTSNLLTSAPTIQYARIDDFGTVAMFNRWSNELMSFQTAPLNIGTNKVAKIKIELFDSAGATLGSAMTIANTPANGGSADISLAVNANQYIIFFGCFPANLDGGYIHDNAAYADWNTHKANVSYYEIQAGDGVGGGLGNKVSKKYTINIICDNSFGYEGIRLAWLNRWGTWDYYTFNKKSVRSLNTKKTQYTQLGGTWNNEHYIPQGYRGGRKNFTVNSTEKLKLNTDFLNDLESEWMEELINSPEVYLLNRKSLDTYGVSSSVSGIVNKYVEPVILTTSSFIRKTQANDNLIQYTIEIERNRTQRTQSI